MVRMGSCYKMGNGWNINFRFDPWVLGIESKIPQIKEGTKHTNLSKVAHLLSSDQLTWDKRKLKAIFEPDDVETIYGLVLPIVSSEDKLC